MNAITQKINELQTILRAMTRVTVAVSGGVDSMTLAHVAHLTLGENALMAHAYSPAVPSADTQRLQNYASQRGWRLELVRTGEMESKAYRENPVNRCYYCKSALYSTLNALQGGQVISGTNLDDLSDYRPGLIAAREQQIRHPFVEAEIDKQTIRAIARHYQLDDIADLPASPCLASRIATGVYIQPQQLDLIARVESWLRETIAAQNIRCRLFAGRLALQIDEKTLSTLSATQQQTLIDQAQSMAQASGLDLPVDIAPYLRGSAFIQAA